MSGISIECTLVVDQSDSMKVTVNCLCNLLCCYYITFIYHNFAHLWHWFCHHTCCCILSVSFTR